MKKIRAFTLIEIIIALLLSSFTIGLAITFYLMINKQFDRFTDRMDKNTMLVQFYRTMKHDFEKADKIRWDANTLELKNPDTSNLTYDFLDEKIVRTYKTSRDTFSIKYENFTTETHRNSELLHYLNFVVIMEGKSLVLSLEKKYPKYILFTEKKDYEPGFE